ncbi:hypothetical protein AGMMS49949_06730 [Alphaproteobacteria bacterium]|nr:hypothetical protein AGMMS49949_06730 [Alphaproteobacteria bacterium]
MQAESSDIWVDIPENSSLFYVAHCLKKAGLIEKSWLFVTRVFLSGKRKKIKAGQYCFSPKMSYTQLMEHLLAGSIVLHKVCLPEGVTVTQALAILKRNPCLKGPLETCPPEGSLLPGTYYFPKGALRKNIVLRLQKAMTKELASLAPFAGELSAEDFLKLASIVEKETRHSHEKGIIAGIFLKRLQKKIYLQADPTVIYGMTQGQSTLGRPLTRQDWNHDSPYNTYKNKGLPPTPICCPGKETLSSVAKAAPSDFLFFVALPDGTHAFNATLDKHNQQIAQNKEQRSKHINKLSRK